MYCELENSYKSYALTANIQSESSDFAHSCSWDKLLRSHCKTEEKRLSTLQCGVIISSRELPHLSWSVWFLFE